MSHQMNYFNSKKVHEHLRKAMPSKKNFNTRRNTPIKIQKAFICKDCSSPRHYLINQLHCCLSSHHDLLHTMVRPELHYIHQNANTYKIKDPIMRLILFLENKF